MQETLKVNRAPVEAHDAVGIQSMPKFSHLGGLLEGGGVHLMGFPVGNVTDTFADGSIFF